MKLNYFIFLILLFPTMTLCMDPITIELPSDIWNQIIAGSKNKEKNSLAHTNQLFHMLSHKNNHALYIHTPLILSETQKKYALLCATYHGNPLAVKNLLAHGASPHYSTIYLTLLPYAVAYWKKDSKTMKILSKYDKHHNHCQCHRQETVPFYAIATYLGDLPALQVYSQKDDYNPYYINYYCNSLLHTAIFTGHSAVVEWLLKDSRITTTASCSGWAGKDALLLAITENHTNIVEQLLKMKTINIVNNRSPRGMTPLHAAVIRQYYSITQLLLGHPKIDINIQLKNGYTPLHIATYNNNLEIVELLLTSKNIDLNIINNNNKTALDIAKTLEDEAIKNVLIKKGAQTYFKLTKIAIWQ